MIKLRSKAKASEVLGFGKIPIQNNQRMLNKDGSSNILRKGLQFFKPHEAYNSLKAYRGQNFGLSSAYHI